MQNPGEDNQIGVNIGYILSGSLGAIIFLAKDSSKKFKTAFLSILAGAIIANYTTPLLLKFTGDNIKIEFALAFLAGAAGRRLVLLIIDSFESKIRSRLSFLFTKNKK